MLKYDWQEKDAYNFMPQFMDKVYKKSVDLTEVNVKYLEW